MAQHICYYKIYRTLMFNKLGIMKISARTTTQYKKIVNPKLRLVVFFLNLHFAGLDLNLEDSLNFSVCNFT